MKLSVDGLHRTYKSGQITTPALIDINLSIDAGEFVAIVGASGSGKTTLLNSIGALDTRFEGVVRLGDQSFSALSEPKLAKLRHRHLGYVFQHFNLLNHLTALENVLLPGFFGPHRGAGQKRGTKSEDEKRATELLTRVGLGDRLHSRPPQLSGGQKQRVAIARALFCRPSIILCDEPTGSLDRVTGLSIMRLFEELNRDENLTLIVVTHEPYIADMARRRITIEDGRLIEDIVQTPKWDDPSQSDEIIHDGEGIP